MNTATNTAAFSLAKTTRDWLKVASIILVIIGISILVSGIAGLITGGIGTGGAICVLGILFIGFSFMHLPAIADAPPKMSTVGTLTGIFFEPTSVFRNLRAHPQ